MLISEIFGVTIQAEGLRVGIPSIFIRFAKCNLKCSGFGVKYLTSKGIRYGCDTYYAVDKEFKMVWQDMTLADIYHQIDKITQNISYIPDIVITGGEPLLYWGNAEFQELLKHYFKKGFHITIETNGTIDIQITKRYQKAILFSISPKLSNSNERYSSRIKKDILSKILLANKDSYTKFVVANENDIFEIKEILWGLPKRTVFIMPLSSSSADISKNSEAIINLATKYGFRYSDRLHIRVWDKKKGV
jgi:organic radical activating enzyme